MHRLFDAKKAAASSHEPGQKKNSWDHAVSLGNAWQRLLAKRP
jgi:hypothetical protein